MEETQSAEVSLHQFVIDELQRVKGQWPKVARETGMSRRTIEKIARRELADPGVSSIERLANYFRQATAA